MLNEKLQKDIDLEAKAEAKKMTARVPIFRHGYEAGWYDAGDKYAEKWQAAEEKAARYEKALNKIVSLSCRVDNRNAILELKSIASMAVAKEQEALTFKTSEDEHS